MSQPLTVWVRTEKNTVYGPLSPSSVELLIDNGVLQGRLQVSLDGQKYVLPGRVPGLRMIFPRALWGDVVVAGDEADAAWAQAVLPPGTSVAPANPRPSQPSGVFMAGPGARAVPERRFAEHRPSSPEAARTSVVMVADAPLLDAALDEGPLLDAAVVEPVPASVTATEAVGSMPREGVLSDQLTGAHLYFRAGAQSLTGALAVSLAEGTVTVHFKKGAPELVESSNPNDAVGLFFVKSGLATEAHVAQANEQRERFGGDVLSALFGLGLLNPNSVMGALTQRAKSLLQRVLWAEAGRFSFSPTELASQRAFPLGHRWALYCEVMRGLPSAESRRRLASALSLPIMRGNGVVPASDFKLTPQETRALAGFTGVLSLGELLQRQPAEGEIALRTAAMLYPADVVAFAASAIRQTPPPPSAPSVPPPAASAAPPRAASVVTSAPAPAATSSVSAAPPPPARPTVAAPVSTPSRAANAASPSQLSSASQAKASSLSSSSQAAAPADAKALVELWERMKKQNHFAVLGLETKADAAAVKGAYLKLARVFHPDTVPPGTPPDVAQLKANIFARVGEANRVLSDAALRKDYAAEVEAGGTGEKVDIAKILAAEEYFQKGQVLVKVRKYAEALKYFDDAIAANDAEPEYFAWRAWARFFGYTDKKKAQVEVLPDIERCIKANPRAAAPHYFKGFILKTNGDTNGAKVCFKKCVEFDPNHIDAQRELRLMK